MVDNGVKFDKGLKFEEIELIEHKFNLKFPEEWKNFYSKVIPISEGFYDWRDSSQKNIEYIKKKIEEPYVNIMECTENIYWDIMKEKIQKAPVLIPIFSHRYLTSCFEIANPVLSICDQDVIYYGASLEEYFAIEFGDKKLKDMDCSKLKAIPFWDEII